jgi:hypothetical protein
LEWKFLESERRTTSLTDFSKSGCRAEGSDEGMDSLGKTELRARRSRRKGTLRIGGTKEKRFSIDRKI